MMPRALPVAINGKEYCPTIGTCIVRDVHTTGVGELLTKGEEPIGTGFKGSMFRLPTRTLGPIKDLAVNIVITGRTLRRQWGGYYLRVKIIFVGDCEADTETGGWMKV